MYLLMQLGSKLRILHWLLQMSFKWFVGFVDGSSCHTCNMALVTWVIYSPIGQLVAYGGTVLCFATDNVAKYRVIIELLLDALSRGIT